MRLSAKNKMKKRDNKYSKFEQLHVKIVEAKNKKNIGNIRVFYRGAVDSYKRMKDAYKLKDDDYLFLNNKKNRTYAHNKMSKLVNKNNDLSRSVKEITDIIESGKPLHNMSKNRK